MSAAGGTFRRFLAIALLLGAPVAAQSPGTQGPPATSHPQVLDPFVGFNDANIAGHQAKMLNIQRQKAIVSDTDKILKLARELNADATSGYSNLSPAERLRKADEIEKLAKNIREKMTYAVGMPAPVNPYAPVWPQR
ncbi:MAG TPA: hypothetical protein VG267_15725 [Terracidiphilus sp.]|jgi:hypothetical protein|nr:hypothetical protein [Terracidiphilus sp.]